MLADPDFHPEHSNPAKWWKEDDSEFPLIAQIARRVLCMPATSAPSERIFSVAGLTISNARARLQGDIAGAQIFLHDAYPQMERLQDLQDDRQGRQNVARHG